MADCDMHTKSRVDAFLGRGLSERALDVGVALEDQLRGDFEGGSRQDVVQEPRALLRCGARENEVVEDSLVLEVQSDVFA